MNKTLFLAISISFLFREFTADEGYDYVNVIFRLTFFPSLRKEYENHKKNFHVITKIYRNIPKILKLLRSQT